MNSENNLPLNDASDIDVSKKIIELRDIEKLPTEENSSVIKDSPKGGGSNSEDKTPLDSSSEKPDSNTPPKGDGPEKEEKEKSVKKSKPTKKSKWKNKPLWLKITLGILGALFIIAILMGWRTYAVAMELKEKATESQQIAQTAYDQFKAQDLPGSQAQVVVLQGKLTEIQETYKKLGFYRAVPFINNYYKDGQHALDAADSGLKAANLAMTELVPYADVLGFQGEDSFTGGTAEDRINLLIDTLGKIVPAFDEISNELTAAKDSFLMIDPTRYPEQIRGTRIRERLSGLQETMTSAVEGFINFRPVLEELPNLAGGNGERKKYLILFQNDNELRPTGGFLTAYAVIFVENGKVTPEKSDDIYELDKKFNKRIPIPEALGKYLTSERYWNLRDMNISPDFKLSMDQFFEHYQNVPGEPDNIDGIIAVDTEVLTNLLRILGPVVIPGGGTFSAEPDARCGDCPQVVYALSEIITKPTPYLREDRKGILGPLMQQTLQKAYSAPKEKWAELFETVWKDVQGRHIQMYFLDENAQAAAEAVNGAGRMIPPDDGSDFLAIVNTNLAGAKSNLFIEYDVKQKIGLPENGMLEKSVEISYKNTRKADNCNLEAGQLCLNATLKDWTRLYLPLGSELISAQGFTTEATTYDEEGFTVIDGFFTLEPLGSAKLKLTYKIPYTDEKIYKTTLWKQGGISPFETLFDVNGGEEKVLVDKDVIVEVEF